MSKTTMNSVFNGIKSKKPCNKSYEFIQKALDRDDSLGTCNVSHIAKWFEQKYKNTYGKEMLGYNFYNCRKVVQELASRYSKTNWQICTYINKWFTTFHSLGYDKVAYDSTLTLGVLKTGWVVDGLYNNNTARNFNTKSKNTSFKVHSTARKAKANNSEIVNEAF